MSIHKELHILKTDDHGDLLYGKFLKEIIL